MKRVGIGIGIAVLTLIGFFIYRSTASNQRQLEALSLIPKDAIYILETTDPIENWHLFSTSNFWNKLKSHPTLTALAEDANYLDSLAADNKFILNLFGKQNFYLSAHMTSSTDYDFLFLLDLKKVKNQDLPTTLVALLTDKEAYTIREDDYQGTQVLSLKDKQDGDELFLASLGGYLVLSYTDELVLNAIDQSLVEDVNPAPLLQAVVDETGQQNLARLYLNYAELPAFIHIYTQIAPELLEAMRSNFSFTGLDIDLANEEATLEGYSALPDSMPNYSRLLQKYGGSAFEFGDIISSRTSFLLALGIDDVPSFYQELLELRNEESKAEYEGLKRKVEKVLGLSLEKDILPWIGEEIVLAQHKPSNLHRQEDDLLLAIKADNIYFAKEKLQKIQRAIKNRTPAKFKKLRYKVYDIYYLDIKNLFGLFFGEAFDQIDRPYYTVLGEYIIFSNDPKTLIATLEDYEHGRVLTNDENYNQVKDDLPDKAAVFAFVSGPRTYESLAQKITPKNTSAYQKNETYLTFFSGIGLSYTSHELGFKNICSIHFSEKSTPEIPVLNTVELAKDFLEVYSTEVAKMTPAETFVLNELEDGVYKKYYANGKQLQFEANTKNGVLHGYFEEFYVNGKLRSKGKYRKGRKVGRWKYYTKDGTIIEKKWEGW